MKNIDDFDLKVNQETSKDNKAVKPNVSSLFWCTPGTCSLLCKDHWN
ncbi:gallidermin/nisin family lantibiotic [Clostridium felsineum]|nr:gallidermin/nisin family lantibiotic [Clostridium felsineum]MCR3758628.1 gallidermin/nisin family lantibiotic [Clostridium felsineum]